MAADDHWLKHTKLYPPCLPVSVVLCHAATSSIMQLHHNSHAVSDPPSHLFSLGVSAPRSGVLLLPAGEVYRPGQEIPAQCTANAAKPRQQVLRRR